MNESKLGHLAAAGVLVVIVTATQAAAQPDFHDLKLRRGDFVYVTTPYGENVSGRVVDLTPGNLAIEPVPRQIGSQSDVGLGREFQPLPGLTIARRGDSLWNGFLIGAAIGSVAGPTIGAEACPNRKIGCVIGGSLTYAGIGMLIDWSIKGRTVIYRAPKQGAAIDIRPEFTADTKTIRLSVSF